MALFEQNQSGGSSLPIEQVKQMQSQGMDNNKIINSLQSDGFSTSQIFDAMAVVNNQSVPADRVSSENPMSNPTNMNQQSITPSGQPTVINTDFQQPVTHNRPSEVNPNNEELIEAIIDEKWNELVDDINKIIDWKNRADTRLSAIETNIKNLRNEFNNLHQGILGRVSDYDKNLLNVGAELKAMENMFSKILPGFLENVQKLDSITERFKNKDPKEEIQK